MKIEHVAFNVVNAIESVEWYVKNLGMEVVRSSTESPYIHFLADSTRESVIEFYSNPVAPIPDYATMHPVMLHIAFVVDDMEATRNRLIEAGATAEGEITDLPNGERLAMLRDPWGLAIQLAQRQPPLV